MQSLTDTRAWLSPRNARFWVVMRTVDDDNFVIASLGPDGNIGRARFALRRIVPSVRDQL